MQLSLNRIIQNRCAELAVSPSAVRNQGKGVLEKTREHLRSVNLKRFAVADGARYARILDNETKRLLANLPRQSRNSWGTARKALNLFLRDCLYNHYLRRHYGLGKSEKIMEIPLDSVVARCLRDLDEQGHLPRWPGLKSLTKETSKLYQMFAQMKATEYGMARVHLDAWLWVEGR